MSNRLSYVRNAARQERGRLDVSPASLLEALRKWLIDTYEIEPVPMDGASFLQGSRGEVVPAEGCLYYDRNLESNSEELVEVFAHELAHLVLHHRQFGAATQDLIRGSVFLDNGAQVLSRYSPKAQQEVEASAFAAEFICSAREVFGVWRTDHTMTLERLAAQYQASTSLIQLQLAEGLHEYIAGDEIFLPVPTEQSLTPEQELAATAHSAPVLLDAGPGTGKTKTLVRRVCHLVREKAILPEKILVLTFSTEAAAELQTRIQATLGSEIGSRILTSTFHGFGVMLLEKLGHHIGLNIDFSILDDISQEELLSELLGMTDCEALLDIKHPEDTASNLRQQINYLKDRLIGTVELEAAIRAWRHTPAEDEAFERSCALHRIYEKYETAKAAKHAVDFADLIQIPFNLLQGSVVLRNRLQDDFPWVLVDEYQDVSRATARLLQQICGHATLPWVVGDARQAIYRFRGAEPENVVRFGEDFPNPQIFQLSENFRSSPDIISTLNRLALWLEEPQSSGNGSDRWRPGKDVMSYQKMPVSLACANNDATERDGIVRAVQSWLADGFQTEDIAVLARRNIDVRNIAIALKRQGIRAVTSGLLTAEGAGGDLAAVLAAVDHHQAIARVAYALYRGSLAPEILNDAVSQLLACDREAEEEPAWIGLPATQLAAHGLWQSSSKLRHLLHSGDGWTVLCDFLFFGGGYLRELLARKDDAESSVQLEEVLSALALAANYRFAHPHVRPLISRCGLAERMRALLTDTAPGLMAPRPVGDAVRVMTCHASKGLEFPAVVVAGQSLPNIPTAKDCLPPQFRPDKMLDAAQAESLLFVGVSRAQSAVLVTYAESATGRPRSKPRRLPNLLLKLRDSASVPVIQWNGPVPENEEISIGRVWGGKTPDSISTYCLASGSCRIRAYLEEHLGFHFRGRLKPLYPEFIQRVRKILSRIVKLAIEQQKKVSDAQADCICEEEWPLETSQDHPHLPLYRPRALRWARSLASKFDPGDFVGATLREEPFQWTDPHGVNRTVKLQLIGEFLAATGERFAIALQVDSTPPSLASVRWSELNDYERLPFVLLHERHGDVQPRVFFAEQGEIRNFQWSTRKPAETTRDHAQQARGVFQRVTGGEFDAKLSDWECDRCKCRTVCPGWIGAISTEPT
jgi:DNA helicase II / ATP-dependent DNA helicase PcrA